MKGYRIKSAACRCRFCPGCCGWLGRKLREALARELAKFKGVMMVTLTVDPLNFPDSPESAFAYVKKRRCVAELVRALHKAGYLWSRRYFYVIEWQQNGYPHWHLLLDATWIPFAAITEVWDKFRPKWLPPPEGVRPPMGSCRFTASKFERGGAAHAANYVAKYLTKHPADGYPDWVMNAKTRIRRFSTSRGSGRRPSSGRPRRRS